MSESLPSEGRQSAHSSAPAQAAWSSSISTPICTSCGAAPPAESEKLTALFGSLVCVPIDSETGKRAGEYLRQYRRSHGVELGDALIAAAAVMNGAALWTRNRKRYPMRGLGFY